MDTANVCRNIPCASPLRTKTLGSRKGLWKKSVGLPEDQKMFYSVKKGTHPLKTQVAVTPDELVVHLNATAVALLT